MMARWHIMKRCSRFILTSIIAVIEISGIAVAVAAGPPSASPVRGIVRAVRQATISTDAALRAVELSFRESDRFKRGDTLAVFDCRRQKADLDAAIAAQHEAALNLETNIQLNRHQAVGRNDVEITRARADKAGADVAGLRVRLDECQLVAPFDGRITELSLRVHERTVPQRSFISIIDDSELEIELIAPSSMLLDLRPGTAFEFRIDELGGRTVQAKVGRLGAGVDPVSKTVKVIGVMTQPAVGEETGILSGMSGTAIFNSEARP